MTNKSTRGLRINPTLLIQKLLLHLGEDFKREGLRETPGRVIKMYRELMSGYHQDEKALYKTFPNNGYNEVVTIANIDFFSLCEHHMIPFFGKVHIGYVPNGRVLGLSKFARIVEMYARRLQTQENLTIQIADSLEKNLHPRGIVVQIEAEHLCVSMRGIKKKGFVTKTATFRGLLKDDNSKVDQFYRDVNSFSRETIKSL